MGAPRTTIVFSDVHLTTEEPVDPEHPLWKRYKQRDLFPDPALAALLERLRDETDGPMELVLNGDVFDFDAVTERPAAEQFKVSWLERLRGLHATEAKSAWKMAEILEDHPVFVGALRDWIAAGHHLVVVIGNHDMDLHWPGVQAELREAVTHDQPEGAGTYRLCPWFYISEGDTLIEHGNQYDHHCLCLDPISPMIRVPPTGETRVRLPFGNYASRYMVNGMGLINPHSAEAFTLPFWGWVVFFYKHVMRIQPFLWWTWMWSSMAAFLASLRDGLLPAEKDVLHLEDRVESIAEVSNSTPRVVRTLDALKVHPSVFFPWLVLRELWLDRLLLMLLVILGSFQALLMLRMIAGVSWWWWIPIFLLLAGPFILYAQSVRSDVHALGKRIKRKLDVIARVVGVKRIVLGHTHAEHHTFVDDVELLNPGSWSPAFRDPECTEPVGRRCIVRIRPEGDTRVAEVLEWDDVRLTPLPVKHEKRPTGMQDQLKDLADRGRRAARQER